MFYSGDEVYNDSITSGDVYFPYYGLTRNEREKIITALNNNPKVNEDDLDTLDILDDEDLLALAEEYGV